MSTRIVVLDTNVILFDAQAIFKFPESNIYIPMSVIEEIDRFKREIGETGRNARQFSRFVDDLREEGKLSDGVMLEKHNTKITIGVDLGTNTLPPDLDAEKADTRILATALELNKQNPDIDVELVSKDIN